MWCGWLFYTRWLGAAGGCFSLLGGCAAGSHVRSTLRSALLTVVRAPAGLWGGGGRDGNPLGQMGRRGPGLAASQSLGPAGTGQEQHGLQQEQGRQVARESGVEDPGVPVSGQQAGAGQKAPSRLVRRRVSVDLFIAHTTSNILGVVECTPYRCTHPYSVRSTRMRVANASSPSRVSGLDVASKHPCL